MAAQASGARKLPAVNDSASFEIAYVTSASCARKRRTLRSQSGTGGEVAHPSDSPTNENLKKELTNMLTSVLGARLSWHFANGWVFEPAIVGPDIVDYTLKEGPHKGRHAIQHFYYQRVAPGVETTV